MSLSLGAVIFIAVKPIAKIFLVLGVGFSLVKTQMLSTETSRGMAGIMVNALLPCLTFSKIVTNLSGSQIKDIGVFVLSSLVIFGTGCVLALIGVVVTPVPKHWRYGMIFSGLFANIADLPIAYVQSMGTSGVFDEKDVDRAVALNVVFLSVMTFLMQNCGLFQLVGKDFKKVDQSELDEEISMKDDPEFQVVEIIDDRGIDGTLSRIRSHESGYSSRSAHRVRSHTMQGLIDEYSEASRIKSINNMEALAKSISKTQIIGLNMHDDDDDDDDDEGKKSKWETLITRYKLGWVQYVLVNMSRVPSIVLVLSFFVTMIPWIRALFVHNSIDVHPAPDGNPPLSFIMDFTQYLGNAAVPTGLILLGGTLARLEVKGIPPGFWKCAAWMVISRLAVMPIIGVLWMQQLHRSGWLEDDISRFLMTIAWSVPSATAQVYFTAFYTPLEGSHEQMDCLAIVLLAQYPVLVVSLPIVLSYVMKVSLNF